MKQMPEPVSQELQASCKDDIKMPRLKAKSSQEKKEKKKKERCALRRPKVGKLRPVAVQLASAIAFSVLKWVGSSPLFCCFRSHTCPLLSPLFLRIWEVPPQPASTAVVEECRVGVGSPQRERHSPSPGGGTLNLPRCPDLSVAWQLSLSEHHSPIGFIHFPPLFLFKLEK